MGPADLTQVVAHRCRALISEGEEAERHHGASAGHRRPRRAAAGAGRTELLYGVWLRRARRWADACGHRRAALALFERLDASPWAERARGVLRASGETDRRRDASTREQLAPQELQVARLAGQGLSNLEIAEQLFVSPPPSAPTCPKVYTKLGITSRADLRQLDQNNGHDGG